MAERLTPGVYVEEVAGAVRPIQGVGTSTAGFIGEAPRGVPDRAEFVSGFRDFERRFGGHRRGEPGFLAAGVEAFFAAGGRRAFVVRVLPADATAGASPDVAARADDAWGVRRDVLRFDAQGNGAWSDHLRLHVEPSTSFADRLYRLRVEWTEGGRSRTVETFDNLSTDPEDEAYGPRVIGDSSRYLRVTDLFQTARDEPPAGPPLPERLPALTTRAPGADGNIELPVGARLTFGWRDASSGLGTDPAEPVAVEFSETVVEDAEGTVTGDVAELTPAQLAQVLGDALGEDFRVTRPGEDDDGPLVRIEPAVASRAYLAAAPPEDETGFDLAARTAVRIIATDGADGARNTVSLDVTDVDAELSAAQLAAALTEEIDGAANPHGVQVEAAGTFLVVSAPAAAAGVRLAIEATGGGADPPWRDPAATIDGAPGLVTDSLRGVVLTVGETIRAGVGRALGGLFATVRSAGLEENDPGDPALRPAETEDTPLRLLGGFDGAGEVGVTEYRGGITDAGRTGMHAFDTAGINMLVMPGRNSPDMLSAAMAYCDAEDVFLVADGIGSTDPDFEISADEVRQAVEGLPARTENAAMFYPWIEAFDPLGVGRAPRRLVPASGHVAGVFARTDTTRGVWKSPAGIEAVVSGAVDLQHRLVDAEQDLLNPIGLNCLRQFPGTGIVVWGSRTLSSDPQHRYVAVRRTTLMLKESIRNGLTWAVFEPNDVDLWDRIRINIDAFMLGLFRQRAFQGATPEEAFAVKCDRETNPQELVDAGIVTAQVAFAPLKPAEFVVILISQKSLLVA